MILRNFRNCPIILISLYVNETALFVALVFNKGLKVCIATIIIFSIFDSYIRYRVNRKVKIWQDFGSKSNLYLRAERAFEGGGGNMLKKGQKIGIKIVLLTPQSPPPDFSLK